MKVLRAIALHALFPALPMVAQDPFLVVPRQYSAEHGMSNRHALSLLQDSYGYIWVGTVSGLDRFDGHSFRTWTVADGLSAGQADHLRMDAQGTIWAIAVDGDLDIKAVDILRPDAARLEPVPDLPVPLKDLIRVGPQRTDGGLVFGARSPARCIWRHPNGSYTVQALAGHRFEPLGDDGSGAVIGLLVDAGLDRRLVTVRPTGEVKVFKELTRDHHVMPLVSGRRTPGALYRVVDAEGRSHYYDTYSELSPELHIDELYPDADIVRRLPNYTPLPQSDTYMLHGTLRNAAGEVLFDVTRSAPAVGGRVKDCLIDRSGDPWLATEFGMYQLDLRGDLFQRWLYRDTLKSTMGIVCRGMDVRGQELFLSTEWDGAYRIDRRTGAVLEHLAEPLHLLATYVDRKERWWRGGPSYVIGRDSDGREQRYSVPDKVWCMLEGREGELILGGLKGLHRLDLTTGLVEPWNDPRQRELDHAHVLQLQRYKEGYLATTSKGLYHLSVTGQVERRWHGEGEGVLALPFGDLHHCHIAADGQFWLATRGHGLIQVDPATGVVEVFTTRTGFPNNMVYAVQADAQGQLWTSTDGGLVRFDPQTGQSTAFTTADGITNDEFNRAAYARSEDGELYFGGLNGITAFKPDHFSHPQEQQHALVFTGIERYVPTAHQWEPLSTSRAAGQAVTLREEDGSLVVRFAHLSFEGDGRVLYAWRLSGVSDAWNYQYEPEVRLDRLPYGDLTLEVRARDARGIWSERSARLAIQVEGPWHASKSALVMATVVATLCAVLLVVFLIRVVRRLWGRSTRLLVPSA
jgi:sugar lactone lactonase YvrE